MLIKLLDGELKNINSNIQVVESELYFTQYIDFHTSKFSLYITQGCICIDNLTTIGEITEFLLSNTDNFKIMTEKSFLELIKNKFQDSTFPAIISDEQLDYKNKSYLYM